MGLLEGVETWYKWYVGATTVKRTSIIVHTSQYGSILLREGAAFSDLNFCHMIFYKWMQNESCRVRIERPSEFFFNFEQKDL